jgi:GNAT superfamily N-acetyltransferase
MPEMLVVRPATLDDIESWLEIVREFEPLAGPMPDFADHAKRGIARGTALVASDGGSVLGACLLSADGARQEIRWIAVREANRRHGVGRLLLDAILARWPTGSIEVVTFTAETAGGEPARRFYEANGFELAGETEPLPNGDARDRYVLRSDTRVRR